MSCGITRRGALGALAGVAACSGGKRSETVRFWAMGREGEVVQTLLPSLGAVGVAVQQLPWSAAHAKLLTAFAGGDLPAVCQMGNTWIPEFAALGALERLDGRVARSKVVSPGDDFAGVWRTNMADGGLYGIPWYVDTRLLFYRRDLLERAGRGAAPTTWDEWLQAMEAIRSVMPKGSHAALLPLNEPEPLITLALQQDESMLRDNGGRGNFQSAGFSRALGFYLDIFRRGLAPLAAEAEIGNLYDEFARGTFAFYVTGPWNLGEFRRRLPPAAQDLWMTAPMPGPGGPGAGIAGGASLVLFRGAPEAAWSLIEHLSGPAAQARFCALTGDLPARRDVWRDAFLARDAKAAAFADQLQRVRPTPAVPEWERIATEMQRVAEQAARGVFTLAQATTEMDRRADRLLEKRRWMLVHASGRA